MAETTSEVSQSEARAAAYRAGILSRAPVTLSEQVAFVVVRGVESGLVTFHAETGLAVANTTIPMKSRDEFPDEGSHLDALGPFLTQYRAVEEINFALKLGWGQWVALTALGVSLPAVGAQNQMIALDLGRQLALVGEGVVTPAALKHVRSTLENRHAETTGLNTPPWLSALETLFRTGVHIRGFPDSAPAAWVLLMLPHFVANVPSAFEAPKAEHLKRAERFLSTLRVDSLKPEFQPAQSRKGPAYSAWRAAVEFAECFGLQVPKNKRDAKSGRGK